MKKRILYIFISILLIFFWQFTSSNNNTVRLLVSSPFLIFEYFFQNYNDLLLATLTTFIEALLGLTIATIFSFSMMVFCFYSPKFMEYILPFMITSQIVPLIVLAPFFIILLGIGLSSKVAMAAVMSFFPIFVNFAQGYKMISSNIHELMVVYQARIGYRIRYVYFPLSMPSIMAGLKISATLAVIGAIVAEFNGADLGLGKNLFLSAKRLEPELMMTSLILSTVVGFTFFNSIKIIEKIYGKWYK